MITSMTKAWEKELLWSEEELTKKSKMKNEGAGLLILGIGILALGVLNHLLLHIIYESDMIWIAVTAGCVLLGVILTGFGVKLINKTGASVAEMTAKDSGYSTEEILEFYREDVYKRQHPDRRRENRRIGGRTHEGHIIRQQ